MTNDSTPLRVRKRWGLVVMFVAFACVVPLFTHGTEAGNAGWSWFLFFGLNALIAAFVPETFF